MLDHSNGANCMSILVVYGIGIWFALVERERFMTESGLFAQLHVVVLSLFVEEVTNFFLREKRKCPGSGMVVLRWARRDRLVKCILQEYVSGFVYYAPVSFWAWLFSMRMLACYCVQNQKDWKVRVTRVSGIVRDDALALSSVSWCLVVLARLDVSKCWFMT